MSGTALCRFLHPASFGVYSRVFRGVPFVGMTREVGRRSAVLCRFARGCGDEGQLATEAVLPACAGMNRKASCASSSVNRRLPARGCARGRTCGSMMRYGS